MFDCIRRMDMLNMATIRTSLPRADTVVVVGNGPVGPESTERINEADVVVRFNNFDNRNGIDQTHRTKRCDVLVTNLDCMPAKGGAIPALVLHAIPAPFQLERNPKLAEQWYPQSRHAMVNPFLQKQLCTELGMVSDGYRHPLPTVGFTWLWHAHAIGFWSDIYICGFTWRYDPTMNLFDGMPPTWDKPLGTMSHHYLSEARWVKRVLAVDKRCRFDSGAQQALAALA